MSKNYSNEVENTKFPKNKPINLVEKFLNKYKFSEFTWTFILISGGMIAFLIMSSFVKLVIKIFG